MIKTGKQIARELTQERNNPKKPPITRQYVYKTLKRAMRKIYKGLKKETGLSPFETAALIAKLFGISMDKDFNFFYHDFPPDVRAEIHESAIQYYASQRNP